MLIKNWRDAGILYEADASGTGEGTSTTSEGGAMSPEQLQAELERTRSLESCQQGSGRAAQEA